MGKPRHVDIDAKPSDGILGFLEGAAKFAFFFGLIVLIPTIAFLFITFQRFSTGDTQAAQDTMGNVDLLTKAAIIGGLLAGIGTVVILWDESGFLGLFAILGAGLFLAPIVAPMMFNVAGIGDVGSRALQSIQYGGLSLGAPVLIGLLVNMGLQMRERIVSGSRADQIKYGRGVRVERDQQNVFMGKCWQLPFCRTYIREKCPIFHSKRTCWRERVGCMCEEKVIRDALANKVIPKDAVAAATFIPYNRQLPMAVKRERCRQCVIYNEHQKQKYKLVLPMVVFLFIGLYALSRGPAVEGADALIRSMNSRYDTLVNPGQGQTPQEPVENQTPSQTQTARRVEQAVPVAFREVLVLAIFLIGFSYAIKLTEFLIFRLKI